MAYKRRYNRKKNKKTTTTYKRRKGKIVKTIKRKYNSPAIMDKKINTLLEFRMKEMIEDAKGEEDVYYTTKGTWLSTGSVYPTTDIPPPLTDAIVYGNHQYLSHEFCRIGGYLNTDRPAGTTVPQIDPRNMNIFLKQISVRLRVCNLSKLTVIARLSIWKIQYNKAVLSNTVGAPSVMNAPLPEVQWEPPFTDQFRINNLCQAEYKRFASNDPNADRRQLIGTSTITIRPPKMLDDLTAGGANRENAEVWRSLRVNKHYKGKGRKHSYQLETQTVQPITSYGSLSNYRYFWSFRANNACYFSAVSACKFCAGGSVSDNVVFDRLAVFTGGTG